MTAKLNIVILLFFLTDPSFLPMSCPPLFLTEVSRRHGISTQAKEATTSYLEDSTTKPNQNGDHAITDWRSGGAFEPDSIEDRSSSLQGHTGGGGGEVIVDGSRGATPHMNERSVAMKLGGRNAAPRRRERTQAQRQPRQQKDDALSADATIKRAKPTLNSEAKTTSKAKNASSLDSRLEAALRRVDLWKQHARPPSSALHAHSDESLAPQHDGTVSSPALRRRNQRETLHHRRDDAAASKTTPTDVTQIMDRASQITDKWRKYDRGLSNVDSTNTIETSKTEDETEKAMVELSSDDFVDVSLSHFIRGVVGVVANSITKVSDSEVPLREEDENAEVTQVGGPQNVDRVVNPSTRKKEKEKKRQANEVVPNSLTKGAVVPTPETEDPIEKSAVARPCHHDSDDNENEDVGIGSHVHVTTRASLGASSAIFSSVSSNDFTVHHHHRQEQEQHSAGINGDSLEEGEDRTVRQGALPVERPTVFEFLDMVATECVGEELKEDVVSCLDSIAEDNVQVSMEDDGLILYIILPTCSFFFCSCP
jgi:hypothetical protein